MANPASSQPATKAALRTSFQAARDALSADAYRRKSAAIVDRVRGLDEIARAATVHVYWPLTGRREVDTRPLIAWLHSQKKQIVLPVVVNLDRSTDEPQLRHVRFGGRETLRPNRWGILEPPDGPVVPLDEIDVVVVPALGAGRNGHRIGHGHGFYDAFLARLARPRVCLVYDACLVASVPAEAHDVPMTVVVTEREVVRPGRPVTCPPGAP